MAFTAIWQIERIKELEWIQFVFGDLIAENVYDGKHEIVRDHCLVIDQYLHARPAAYYRSFQGKNAFLVHLSDETYEGGYEYYRCFRGVFRNYWSSVFDPAYVMTFPLGFTQTPLPPGNLPKAHERKYLWSFLGEANKASRPEMLSAMHSIRPQFVYVTDDRGKPQIPLSRSEYQDVLLQSVFVPSPMGNVNLECWRIYEALESGAVPILERRVGLNYFDHLFGPNPLPTFRRWSEARRFVAEIASDTVRMEDFRMGCYAWWQEYKKALKSRIAEFAERESATAPHHAVSTIARVPGWHVFELLRHHSLGAIQKRISLQARRLVLDRKLRVTAGR